MKIKVTEYPKDNDFLEVKRRALVTVGKKTKTIPDEEWIVKILKANHSPIRRLRFSFDIYGIPSWIATHLCRHIHAQPYVKSQRNDRQTEYDRNKAPQDAPVDMIWDMNAEELITICHKRLCLQASKETRDVILERRKKVLEVAPHMKDLLVPLCKYSGGICEEMFPCGKKEE